MANLWRQQPSGRISTSDLVRMAAVDASALVANEFFEASGVDYYGILKRWTGSVWGKALLKTYLGGVFQAKPLKRWDGSAWKLIDSQG